MGSAHHGTIVLPDTEGRMHVKLAVESAKKYVADLFAEEEITNVGLEEVKFDDSLDRWIVTIGFSRPWDQNIALTTTPGKGQSGRSYKVLQIADTDGRVLSLKDRFLRGRN